MADQNGDYLSRFERVEKTLEQTALLTLALAERMKEAEKRMDETEKRMVQQDARIDKLAGKVDDLVGAIRSLIDRIPPQSLR